mmetsp:Transcript_26735/g.107073  ORF Transcript_26735/g.107073 Transcript_26735/m.107073 type:complete len:425 (-) Transcript_26735:315-1589(-)
MPPSIMRHLRSAVTGQDAALAPAAAREAHVAAAGARQRRDAVRSGRRVRRRGRRAQQRPRPVVGEREDAAVGVGRRGRGLGAHAVLGGVPRALRSEVWRSRLRRSPLARAAPRQLDDPRRRGPHRVRHLARVVALFCWLCRVQPRRREPALAPRRRRQPQPTPHAARDPFVRRADRLARRSAQPRRRRARPRARGLLLPHLRLRRLLARHLPLPHDCLRRLRPQLGLRGPFPVLCDRWKRRLPRDDDSCGLGSSWKRAFFSAVFSDDRRYGRRPPRNRHDAASRRLHGRDRAHRLVVVVVAVVLRPASRRDSPPLSPALCEGTARVPCCAVMKRTRQPGSSLYVVCVCAGKHCHVNTIVRDYRRKKVSRISKSKVSSSSIGQTSGPPALYALREAAPRHSHYSTRAWCLLPPRRPLRRARPGGP